MLQVQREVIMLQPDTALIYTMVLMSAADGDMTDAELGRIGVSVRTLPAFEGYDEGQLAGEAEACAEFLNGADGLESVLDLIASALPARLGETAYALACDIAAADANVAQEEARLLELLRHRLDVDRLAAAAIERGARARYQAI
jgi:tellurite resistance protein